FFIAMGFYRPHCPYISPKKYFDMYPVEEIELPEEPDGHLKKVPEAALFTNPLYWDLDEQQRKEAIRAYYAAITFMDAQLGKVLDALEDMGMAENTVVVFRNDHGYLLTEHGKWMKQSLFEETARVPLIISAPGAKGNGNASDRVVELLDLYPTLAALCGLEAPPYLDGKNLRPLLDNPGHTWDHPAFTQVQRRRSSGNFMGRSVRTERWRYSDWDYGERGVELYDRQNDPGEYQNLADDPAYAK